jgi:hypothetical protein
MNKKEKKEYQILLKFTEKYPFPIIADSIKNEKPPKPDISCKLKDGKSIAFELVEIIDDGLAKRLNDKLEIERIINQKLNDLNIEKKIFKDRMVIIDYHHNASKNKKISIIDQLIAYIIKIECRIGDYYFNNEPGFNGTLHSISIIESNYDNQRFSVNDFGSIGNPVLEQVKKKFDNSYERELEIELLAYYQLFPNIQERIWLPNVREFVQENITSSPFKKIWIFSVTQEKIIFSFPN